MKERILQAYRAVCGGYSADRVVADPDLNTTYLETCSKLGLDESPKRLNQALLNARKSGKLPRPDERIATRFDDIEDYRFASEIAARFLEQKHQTTVDGIICDPELAAEFDAVARQLAPGFDSLRYRWAALNLRKTRRLKPELMSRIVPAEQIELGEIESIQIDSIPVEQGLYVFYSPSETLYVGESENLRKRVAKHLDHSDNRGLARWLWEHGAGELRLEVRRLAAGTQTRIRRALETELVASL